MLSGRAKTLQAFSHDMFFSVRSMDFSRKQDELTQVTTLSWALTLGRARFQHWPEAT